MLGWALSFAIVALIAAALGFGGIVGVSATIAQALFVLFALLFAGTVIRRIRQGKPPV